MEKSESTKNKETRIGTYKSDIKLNDFQNTYGKSNESIEKNNEIKKVCFAASSGGHYEQLMMLKPLMDKYSSFILTEKTQYTAETKGKKIYYLEQVNRREKSFVLRMIVNSVISFKIFIKEKPDAIICTGVLAMIPMCLLAKIFRKELIYIESFAKVTSATETGKLLYKFADQFYVQWEPMLKIFPNAIYKGGIY
ncbi:MAG: PssD/Cps14F family polysaccharide biosynthesis glycosyltransferase [Aminipila sp.]